MLSGVNLEMAHQMGMTSGWQGGALGAGIGSGAAYKSAVDNKINPWTGKPEKIVVTGRDQPNRVNPTAEKIGAETISEDLRIQTAGNMDLQPSSQGKYNKLESKMFNRDWLHDRMTRGYANFDMGPGSVPGQSVYYNMELRIGLQYPQQQYHYRTMQMGGSSLQIWYRK